MCKRLWGRYGYGITERTAVSCFPAEPISNLARKAFLILWVGQTRHRPGAVPISSGNPPRLRLDAIPDSGHSPSFGQNHFNRACSTDTTFSERLLFCCSTSHDDDHDQGYMPSALLITKRAMGTLRWEFCKSRGQERFKPATS